jgi:peptide-methionine (S)-S-oxide reductase
MKLGNKLLYVELFLVSLLLTAVIWPGEVIAMCDKTGHCADPNNANTEKKEDTDLQIATFAAGCFWGVEAAFRQVEGIKSTLVGYTGGRFKNPSYKDVCSGKTGHAEAVQITYDPNMVSYEKLVEMFWIIHDPTTRNRQGPDVGTQYRSAIFFHTPEQAKAALLSKNKHQKKIKKRIVTEIKRATEFYKAEEYHQRYLEKKGKASCHPSLK